MEKQKKTLRNALVKAFTLILLACLPFVSFTQTVPPDPNPTPEFSVHPFVLVSNLSAIVKEQWNGGAPVTHANDSLFYKSGGNSYKGYTDSSGNVILTDTNYTAGNNIVMEACANNEITGKFYNQALSKVTSDPNLMSPTFTITALSTGDSIPVRILVTDMLNNARSGYAVQFKLSGSNYGSAAYTNSSGVATYGLSLTQGQSYTVTASGSAGTSSPLTVSTSPMTGTSGNFSGIYVYIRY